MLPIEAIMGWMVLGDYEENKIEEEENDELPLTDTILQCRG